MKSSTSGVACATRRCRSGRSDASDGRQVRLPSLNPLSLNNTYPELVDALAKQDTSFARLQGRLGITDPEEAKASGIAVFYYVCCV